MGSLTFWSSFSLRGDSDVNKSACIFLKPLPFIYVCLAFIHVSSSLFPGLLKTLASSTRSSSLVLLLVREVSIFPGDPSSNQASQPITFADNLVLQCVWLWTTCIFGSSVLRLDFSRVQDNQLVYQFYVMHVILHCLDQLD